MNGSFTIPSLDPTLLFNLLAVAPGHEPQFQRGVDPALGAVPFELTARPAADPATVLQGRILDPDGEGVLGATVSAFGFTVGDRSTFGTIQGLDPLAVTDADGRFVLAGAVPDRVYHVEVRARALAVGFFDALEPDSDAVLKLAIGGTIRGRLTHEGRPLLGVTMGLVQARRGVEGFAGELTIATDDNGRFTFLNTVTSQPMQVYAKMASMKDGLAVAAVRIDGPPNGGTVDAGELLATAGVDLSGRVELSDGKVVPPGTRLLVSREQAWDSLTTDVGTDGTFALKGLPPEAYTLSVRVRGYRLSPDNQSFDPINRGSLLGWIRTAKRDMRIRLEPGGRTAPGKVDKAAIEQFRRRREEPMRGVETAK